MSWLVKSKIILAVSQVKVYCVKKVPKAIFVFVKDLRESSKKLPLNLVDFFSSPYQLLYVHDNVIFEGNLLRIYHEYI